MQLLGKNLGKLGLADSRRTYEEETSYGLVIVQKSGLGHENGLCEGFYGLFLAEYLLFEAFLHMKEIVLCIGL